MKKIRIFALGTMFTMVSFVAFALADVTNQCDNPEVVSINPDASHPFWGSSVTATYGYTAPDGCVYSVSCVTKYRF